MERRFIVYYNCSDCACGCYVSSLLTVFGACVNICVCIVFFILVYLSGCYNMRVLGFIRVCIYLYKLCR
uniref:Cysteine-rich protein n=1 Tax=Potato mop-top virus TaxID=37128 RepID=C0H5P2_9VIRU|nr:cysteine rich protein [Potato mop-top virus]QIA61088.1 cysteine rich protein [Potato mop-top virus]QIA61092.1 cysteine rich protein [Potato mop-top virus]QIA61096.1 cysteine rich protein [Potato mop-top virus]CAM78270.1 cysteine rich protein [Potato mop-top virus]